MMEGLREDVSYIFDIVGSKIFKEGNHRKEFDIEMIFKPR